MRAALLREVPGELEIDDVEVGDARPPRGARAHRRRRPLPLRPALHGGQVPLPAARRARPRVGRRRRGRRRPGHLRAARRPRDHLPLRVLRQLRAVPHRPPVAVHAARTPTRRGRRASRRASPTTAEVATSSSTWARSPSGCSSTSTRLVKIRDGHAARPRRADRLRRHHRRRRRVQHGQVEPGSTVAVIGCGGVGLNCIQGAAIAGAGEVIAVDMLAVQARAGASSSAPPTPSTRPAATRSARSASSPAAACTTASRPSA